MDGDIYEVPGLFCTNCGHDLNHELYSICQHPILEAPLCILCSEEIQEKFDELQNESNQEFENREDLCYWCFLDEDATLFLCDNPSCPLTSQPCEFQFCSRCIEENLGSKRRHEIEHSSQWYCFVCDPNQLETFQKAIEQGRKHSKLEELKQFETITSSNQGEDVELTSEKMEHAAWVLTNLVEQIEESLKMIDPNMIAEKENAIRKELMTNPLSESVAKLSRNEIDLYCQYWQRHIDILQREEAILFEMVESYGYDPRDLEVYKLDVERLEKDLPFAEKQAVAAAEATFRDIESQFTEKKHEEAEMQSGKAAKKKPPVDFKFEEEVVEEDNLDFERVVEFAQTNDIVQKFIQDEDVDTQFYPQSFEKVVPVVVLKALFHASRKERKTLEQTLNIPPHISIIMSYVDKEFPVSTIYWSFAGSVHPAVLKALYYTQSSVESAIICKRYQLDPAICGVTDFGNTRDVYDLFMKEKSKTQDPSKKTVITEKEVAEALETEETKDQEEFIDFEAREARYYARSSSHRSHEESSSRSSQTSRPLKQADLKSFFQIKCKDEAADERKILSERKAEVLGRLKNESRKKKSVTSSSASAKAASTSTRSTKQIRESVVRKQSVLLEEEKPIELPGKAEMKESLSKEDAVSLINDPLESSSLNSVREEEEMEIASEEDSDSVRDIILQHPSRPQKKRTSASGATSSVLILNSDMEDNDEVKSGKGDDGDNKEGKGEIPTSSSSPAPLSISEKHDSKISSVEATPLYWKEDDNTPVSKEKKLNGNFVDLSYLDEDESDGRAKESSDESYSGGDDSDIQWLGTISPKASSQIKKKPISDLDTYEIDSDGELLKIDDLKTKKFSKLTKSSSLSSRPSQSNSSRKRILAGGSNNMKRSIQSFFSRETAEAKKAERARRAALESFNYYQDDENAITLNTSRPEGEPSINVSSNFVSQLKAHQVDGLRFLWKNVIGSIAEASKTSKSAYGCVLAHCMGLGKTFTIIAFVVTLLTHPRIRVIEDPKDRHAKEKARDAEKLKLSAISDSARSAPVTSSTPSASQDTKNNSEASKDIATDSCPVGASTDKSEVKEEPLVVKRLIFRILIVVPKNTLQNWIDEFKRWTPEDLLEQFNLILINSTTQRHNKAQRLHQIQRWFEEGGVLVIGYEMFRYLVGEETNAQSSQIPAEDRLKYQEYLLKPGADLVIADEAHIIKNAKSQLSRLLEKVVTRRRVALTGSPLQNNLEEYWVMVNWVKRLFLYNIDEYRQIFVNPIKQGSNKDASLAQVLQMKKRTHVLNQKLIPIVHRRDNLELRNSLLPKREFILSIKMTDFQKFLYKYYLSRLPTNGRTLFKAYQCLMRIWNHPCTAIYHDYEQKEKKEKQVEKEKDGEGTEAGKTLKKPGRPSFANLNGKATRFRNATRFTPKDFRHELRQSFAYYLYCTSSTSSGSKMKEIETAAQNQEKRMLVGKEQQNLALLREADAQLAQQSSIEVDYVEPVHNDEEEEDPTVSRREKQKRAREGNEQEELNSEEEFSMDEDEEEEEEESDLDGFVVDDDEVEYEDDVSESELESEWISSGEEEDERQSENSDEISSNGREGKKRKRTTRKGQRASKRRKVALKESKGKKLRKVIKKTVKGKENPKKKADGEEENEEKDDTEMVTQDDISPEVSLRDEEASGAVTETPSAAITPCEDLTAQEGINTSSSADLKGLDARTSPAVIDTLVEEETQDIIESDWWKFQKEIEEIPSALLPSLLEEATLSGADLIALSSKMMIFLGLLAFTVKAGDKMLVFSQSLFTLNVIEAFLGMASWGHACGVATPEEVKEYALSCWRFNQEYIRIDGSISNRQQLINDFNQQRRFKLMLISTKAGNMGINLQSANRVVIFDSSWNPVHDLQAIFRTYRFGQQKIVFVYRLYAAGSMEEKIHKNQVVKQSLSERVVDKKMPENHFTDKERAEYLAFIDEDDEVTVKSKKKMKKKGEEDGNGPSELKANETEKGEDKENGDGSKGEEEDEEFDEDPMRTEMVRKQKLMELIGSGTKDDVLLELISRIGTKIFKSVEDHDSLLADKLDQHLNEEEQKLAVEEFEKEAQVHLRVQQAQAQAQQAQMNNLAKPQTFVPSSAAATPQNLSRGQIQAIDDIGNQLIEFIDTILVPASFSMIYPTRISTSLSSPSPPETIPTNIPGWSAQFDFVLIVLSEVYREDTSLSTVTGLVNKYVRKSNAQPFPQSIYQRRLRDIRLDARGYLQKYLTNGFVKMAIQSILSKRRDLFAAIIAGSSR